MTYTDKTWTKKRVVIVVVVAFAYGIWFNVLDSLSYCQGQNRGENCVPIGDMLKVPVIGEEKNNVYQTWNIIGHCIPGLFMLLFKPRKLELFIAGVLISSAVMDSPLWGMAKLWYMPLWHEGQMVLLNGTTTTTCYAPTENLSQWIAYYYNPIGLDCPVWEGGWIWHDFPTAAVIFWSVVGRVVGAAVLIWWQNRQESLDKEFSLLNILIKRLGKIKIKQ